MGMDLTYDECDLLLAGLFDLTITYLEDDEKVAPMQSPRRKLGGDPDARFFEVSRRDKAPTEAGARRVL